MHKKAINCDDKNYESKKSYIMSMSSAEPVDREKYLQHSGSLSTIAAAKAQIDQNFTSVNTNEQRQQRRQLG